MALVDTLSELCRELLVLAGLSLFMEVLLPVGELKKYAQFVMGLLVVAAMLNPLLGFTKGLAPSIAAEVFTDRLGAELEKELSGRQDNTQQIIAAGSSLDDSARIAAAQQLTDSLERQIGSLCSLAIGVEGSQVQVELNEAALAGDGGHNWGRIIIVLTVASDAAVDKEAICREIRQTVADFYDIELAAVQVSVAEYSET